MPKKRLFVGAALAIAVLVLTVSPARSATGAHQPGAALLTRIQNGDLSCADVSPTDFELVGEYDMRRIMGSTSAYNAMDAQMQTATHTDGTRSAYRFMGERLTGCARGNGPIAFGTMMDIMGSAELGASHGADPAGGASSSMMGADAYGSRSGGTDWGLIAICVVAALALLALIVFLLTRRGPRRPMRPRTA